MHCMIIHNIHCFGTEKEGFPVLVTWVLCFCRRNLLNVLHFHKRPNASTLVSGTRDRVNLYGNFKNATDASFPGTIDHLTRKNREECPAGKTILLGFSYGFKGRIQRPVPSSSLSRRKPLIQKVATSPPSRKLHQVE